MCYRSILEYSPDIIVMADLEGRIIEFSRGAEKLLGYRREEVLGMKAEELYLYPSERRRIVRIMRKQGAVTDFETRASCKGGEILDISISLSYLRDPQGREIGSVGICKDISKRKQLERQLKKLAHTDQLTGLFNRAYFNLRIDAEVERARQHHRPLVLLLFDLDGFKGYNDRKGHLAGDSVLRRVGHLVSRTLGSAKASGFRYGGDEFTVLLADAAVDAGLVLARRLAKHIAAAYPGEITASIGIAPLGEHDEIRDFIHRADSAMYRAKGVGGNAVCVADRDAVHREPVHPPEDSVTDSADSGGAH